MVEMKYGTKRERFCFVILKTIDGETRSGFQRWVQKYYERLDGFGHRVLDWYDWEWLDR
jgi:hypothetical protein